MQISLGTAIGSGGAKGGVGSPPGPEPGASWWLPTGVAAANCIAAYKPRGAASLAASYVNLAHPGTNDAAPGAAPAFDPALGWIFYNPNMRYLTTGIVPAVNLTWSCFVQYSAGAAGQTNLVAASTGTSAYWGIHHDSSGNVYYMNGYYTAKTPGQPAGNLGFAGNKGYRMGVDDGVTIPAGTGTLPPILIGADNIDGTPSQFVTANIEAFAIYDVVLTPTQVTELVNNMEGVTLNNWWLANGTILAPNVREHVRYPGQGQLYTGGSITNGTAWSMAVRTNSIDRASSGGPMYLFSNGTDTLFLGVHTGSGCLYLGGWAIPEIFAGTANHVFFLVSNGSTVTAYVDNVAVGTPAASNQGIVTPGARWRSHSSVAAPWPNVVQGAAVYNIALDATQRAALYTAMGGLPALTLRDVAEALPPLLPILIVPPDLKPPDDDE